MLRREPELRSSAEEVSLLVGRSVCALSPSFLSLKMSLDFLQVEQLPESFEILLSESLGNDK